MPARKITRSREKIAATRSNGRVSAGYNEVADDSGRVSVAESPVTAWRAVMTGPTGRVFVPYGRVSGVEDSLAERKRRGVRCVECEDRAETTMIVWER